MYGGAYYRREIRAELIFGGKFVSAILKCAKDNIGELIENYDMEVCVNVPTSKTITFIENVTPYIP